MNNIGKRQFSTALIYTLNSKYTSYLMLYIRHGTQLFTEAALSMAHFWTFRNKPGVNLNPARRMKLCLHFYVPYYAELCK
jgi:hypothetical protein